MKWRMKLLAAYVLATVSLLGLFIVDAQEQKLGAGTAPVAATPAPNPLPSAKKSYPLPEPLATKISQLVDQRNLTERALLNYISDPKIYESQDETIRAAVFDRQSKLYSQFATSMKQINEWILAQRKEFKCDTCEASRDKDGKWSFAEPEQLQQVTGVQGGTK